MATWPYREEVFPLWDLRTQKKFSPATYAGQPRYFCNDIGESCNALGLAAQNGKVYVSLFYEDKLLVLDGTTAEKTGEIEVEKPVGLHATPAGILAVSRESVKLVDPGDEAGEDLDRKEIAGPALRDHRPRRQRLRERLGNVLPGEGVLAQGGIPAHHRQGRGAPG